MRSWWLHWPSQLHSPQPPRPSEQLEQQQQQQQQQQQRARCQMLHCMAKQQQRARSVLLPLLLEIKYLTEAGIAPNRSSSWQQLQQRRQPQAAMQESRATAA
jgi:hypothetical protein